MPNRASTPRRQRGLSLIEIVVALAIAVIVVGNAVPSFQQLLARRQVAGRAAELSADLYYARGAAVARNDAVRLSFEHGSFGECYTMHTGAEGDCSCSSGAPAQCRNGAQEIKTVRYPADAPVRLQANVASLVFDRINGATKSGGSVTLTGPREQSIRHVVNRIGRLRSCTPAADIPGLRPC